MDLTGSTDGSKQLAVKLSNDGTLVNDSGSLKVGTIANANVAANAAIDQSKISGLTDALAGKQAKFTNGATGENANTAINATVQTTVRDSSNATDNDFATEKAIRTAIDTATSGISGKQAQLKSHDANGSNIEAVVVDSATGIATTNASDTKLATEAAIRAAINNVASDTMTLTNKTIVASANSISGIATTNMDSGAIATAISGSPVDTKLASEKAVSDALALKQNSLTNGASSGGEISSTVKTSVATTNASDNDLVTEKAVRDAITAATAYTSTTGVVMTDATQTLTNKTIAAGSNNISGLGTSNFASGTIQTAVRAATGEAGTIATDTNLVTEKAVRTALDNQRINILATWGSNSVTQTTIAPTPTQQPG